MNGKAPAFQFYASDFLSGTTFLSAAAVGAYIRMLAQSWEHGPIPDTPMALHKAMGLGPLDPSAEAIWSELSCKWKRSKNGWTNDKLERVRREQIEYRKGQHRAGIASGRKRRELSRERSFNGRSTTVVTEREPEGQPDGQPKPNPPVFDLDLRSSSLSPSSPSPSGRASAPTPIIDGREVRRHGEHVACFYPSRPNLCVTRYIHDKCKGAIGGDPDTRDDRLAVIYRETIVQLGDQPVGENALNFWENIISGIVPAATKPSPSGKRTAAQITIATAHRG